MSMKVYDYILQGEIYDGTYKGVYKANREGMEAIFNLGVKDAIVIRAQNLDELSKTFLDKTGLELKGKKLDAIWDVNIPNTKRHIGYFRITRR